MKKDKKYRKLEKKAEKPAILFSFDGTVMDTEAAILATYRHIFANYGIGDALSGDRGLAVLDKPVDEVLHEYLPDEDLNQLTDDYNSWQETHLINLIQPMKGIRELLEWLKKKGYKVGIASTRMRESIVTLLEHTQLMQYFDVIIGARKQNSSHVHLDAILTACRLMQAKRCIFIGDSAADIDAGIRAGAYTIGYVSNPAKSQLIIETGPDFVTTDFSQVKKLLQGEALWLAYELIDPEKEAQEQAEAEKKAEKKKAKKKSSAKKKKKSSEDSDHKKGKKNRKKQ